MSLADLARDLAGLSALPGFEEYAAQQRALDERALFLQQARPISREDALAVALFSRGTWAQRYPVRSHDLGDEAALFVADWLTKWALSPESNNMHDALSEWQGGMFLGRMRLAIAVGAK